MRGRAAAVTFGLHRPATRRVSRSLCRAKALDRRSMHSVGKLVASGARGLMRLPELAFEADTAKRVKGRSGAERRNGELRWSSPFHPLCSVPPRPCDPGRPGRVKRLRARDDVRPADGTNGRWDRWDGGIELLCWCTPNIRRMLPRAPDRAPREGQPLQAHPLPLLQARFFAMHESPHAFPCLHTMQHPPDVVGPSEHPDRAGAALSSTVQKSGTRATRIRRMFISIDPGIGWATSGHRM